MKIEINLATRFYVNFQRVNLFILLAGFILIIWVSASIYAITANIAELGKFSLSAAKMTAKSSADQVSEIDYNKMLAEVKYVNSIIARRSVNWLALFDHLELLVPNGVALSAIEPGAGGETLKISGSARDFVSIRKFMENLEGSRNFTETYLTDHSIVKFGSQKGLTFSVTCKATI